MISTSLTRFTWATVSLAATFFFLAQPNAFGQIQSAERSRQLLGLNDDEADLSSLYSNFKLTGSLEIAAWNPNTPRKLAGDAMREQLEREVLATDDPILIKAVVNSNYLTTGSHKAAATPSMAREIRGLPTGGASASESLDMLLTLPLTRPDPVQGARRMSTAHELMRLRARTAVVADMARVNY